MSIRLFMNQDYNKNITPYPDDEKYFVFAAANLEQKPCPLDERIILRDSQIQGLATKKKISKRGKVQHDQHAQWRSSAPRY